jgi:hypothetical protein
VALRGRGSCASSTAWIPRIEPESEDTLSITKLASLTEARAELEKIDWQRATVVGPWSVGQVLVHCAQSIEFSMTGFPEPKSWLFRATVGPLALSKFLRQGYMRHDLEAAIPGAPALEALDANAALARLFQAMDAFSKCDRFADHFAYGPVAKPEYDRVQAMHIADHLASLSS